jgi:cyclopropane-fatty-acyl-phospholipid synthase
MTTAHRSLDWQDLDLRLCRSAIRSVIAQRIFRRATRQLGVCVVMKGEQLGDQNRLRMMLDRPDAFFSRVGCRGSIGLGESYMAGDWSAPDLPALLTLFAGNAGSLVPLWAQPLRGLALPRAKRRKGTRDEALRDASHHYDLPTALFETFLDPSMTYSSAMFADQFDDLNTAQLRKIRSMLALAKVTPGDRVLEIGGGWGTLAVEAARLGADVTSINVSERQLAAAVLAAKDMAVTFRHMDYRDVTGEFDAVMSVEMIEAVGLARLETYFSSVARVLKPGGRFALQAIITSDARMRATLHTDTWIKKYIFPGGCIPSEPAITRASAACGLRLLQVHRFGASYARTLTTWRETFLANVGNVHELGYDHTFCRMWEFYLAYCEAGFRSGDLDVVQVAFERV